MIAFPNAKINIGLNVLGKRSDGFHDIYSCFYPIPWCDVLEVIEGDKLEFHPSGLDIPGNEEDNLCLQAYSLLASDFKLPPVNIYLHKVIPIGAGLGGGSADASFLLKLLNEKYALGITIEKLEEYASLLGSDCPFFIRNQPVIATQTGNSLAPCTLDLSELFIVLVNPGIHISTSEAYGLVKFSRPPTGEKELFQMSQIDKWKNVLTNDFEFGLFELHPRISEIKNSLYELGARYASMTGSGSTIYGLFNHEVDTSSLKKLNYSVFQKQMTLNP